DSTVLVWDVAAVRRRTEPLGKDLRPVDFDRLWDDLAGSDVARAFTASGALATAPEAVQFLRQRLAQATAVSPEQVRRWITDLDGPQFTVRQRAMSELKKAGEQADVELQKVLEGKMTLEVRQRVERLLTVSPLLIRSPETLRRVRAIQALERIGTADARQVLE